MNLIIKGNVILLVILLFTANSYADGLGSLSEVGKNQDEMVRVLNKETKIYQAVKKAVETGTIKEGQPQDSILDTYGEPVIVLKEYDDIEKWVYKPGHATYFDSTKIYLFFGADKKLKKIEVF